MQALLAFLARTRIILLWIALQAFSLSLYIISVETLRHRSLYFLEVVTAAIHQTLHWLTQPITAMRLYRELERQNAHLLEALASYTESTAPLIVPLQVWGLLSPEKNYEFIPVHSLYQSLHARKNYLLIDAGGKAGLYPGLCVINPSGIVGFVAETTATYSKVLPLFNENVQLAVQIARSGHLGLTSWRDRRTFNEVEVLYVPLYATVEVGDEVWSAPQSTLAPGGLRIGRIARIIPEPTYSFQRLIVRTYIDWFRLGPLYVLKPRAA